MAIRSMPMRNVREQLEKAVAALPGEPASPQDEFDRYEMVSIQIADSSASLGLDEALTLEYLHTYLYLLQQELGLLPDMEE